MQVVIEIMSKEKDPLSLDESILSNPSLKGILLSLFFKMFISCSEPIICHTRY